MIRGKSPPSEYIVEIMNSKTLLFFDKRILKGSQTQQKKFLFFSIRLNWAFYTNPCKILQ